MVKNILNVTLYKINWEDSFNNGSRKFAHKKERTPHKKERTPHNEKRIPH